MKRLADFVQDHGRALVLIAVSVALAGFAFIFRIPVSIFPQTDFPRIIILVDNGIAPVDVQMLSVTKPVEEAVRIVPGITDIRSITARGSSEISVSFRWDVDILNALHLVQGRLGQIAPTLPPGARFYINRLTFAVFPMIGFSMTSPSKSLSELWELAYYDISPRIYRVPGVAETRIVGGRPTEYHVIVDPPRLNAYGLPLTKVVEALRTNNMVAAAGMVQENYHLYLTTVNGLLRDREQIENTVISVVNGTPVLVKNVAHVVPGEKPIYNIVTANGHPAVLVNVLQQPDGNAIQIANDVNAELRDIQKSLPKDVSLSIFYDQSVLVRDSISGVIESMFIGLLLSVGVLIMFLKNGRTTLVAVLVIPLATLTAVVFMRLFDMSFNLMTLGGLAACIGVVIDDAIVMVENIVVHLSHGQSPLAAAKSAIVELTPALIGSTLTPIVVFVPLVFLGGITAVFFRALALTLVTALFASLVLAIFVTPVVARFFLRIPGQTVDENAAPWERAETGRLLRWASQRYEGLLQASLRRPRRVMLASLAVLGGSVALYFQLGSGFLPEMDERATVLDYIMPPGTSLEETDRVLKKIEGFLSETPDVESYSRRTGARLALAIAEPNTGDFLIKLKRDGKRPLSEVTDELRIKIKTAFPGLDVEFPHILEDLIGDLISTPEPIEIKVYHRDAEVFKKVTADIAEWVTKVRGVVDIVNRTVVIGPSANFRVDLENAQRAGFSVQDVASLGTAILEGEIASNMIRDNRLVGVRVRYPAEYRSSVDTLKTLLVTSPTGQTVPLSSISHVEMEEGATEIRRDNLRNISAVTAQIAGRDLGSTMDEIKERLPKEVALPPGTEVYYGGLYQIQQESFAGLVQVLIASIFLIFVILVFEFRSFSHPIAIVVATVLCGSGTLLALFLTGHTLNISSFMGAIMVVGIVHKNGILMLDAERAYSAQGHTLQEAIYQAGRRRLRPILMTALATIFGMLPLAIGVGSGAQLLQPLAIAVIGGVTVSMVLSLLVTPSLFCWLRERGL